MDHFKYWIKYKWTIYIFKINISNHSPFHPSCFFSLSFLCFKISCMLKATMITWNAAWFWSRASVLCFIKGIFWWVWCDSIDWLLFMLLLQVQSFLRGWMCRRKWKTIIQDYIRSPHAESMRKRNQVVFSMLEAESEYVQQLHILVNNFLRPLRMAASSKKPSITHDDVSSIFLNR